MLNVSLLVAQSKFKPSKREIRLLRSSYSPGGTSGHLLVIIINWLGKHCIQVFCSQGQYLSLVSPFLHDSTAAILLCHCLANFQIGSYNCLGQTFPVFPQVLTK